jgi:hypothetical protein
VDRPEDVGGSLQVLDRELEEEALAREPLRGFGADRIVVDT